MSHSLFNSCPPQKKKWASVYVLPLIVFLASIIEALNSFSVTTVDMTQGEKKETYTLHMIFP